MEELNVTTNPEIDEMNNPELDSKWLTFWLDGQLFGSSIAHVEQILSMMPITEVPEYPHYAKGIINIRGSIVPLIDLRLRLGKKEAEYTEYTCIIICGVEGNQVGFIADSVDAVLTIPPEAIAEPPKMGEDSTNRYLVGVARLPDNSGEGEKLVLCLDTTKVLLRTELNDLNQE